MQILSSHLTLRFETKNANILINGAAATVQHRSILLSVNDKRDVPINVYLHVVKKNEKISPNWQQYGKQNWTFTEKIFGLQ